MRHGQRVSTGNIGGDEEVEIREDENHRHFENRKESYQNSLSLHTALPFCSRTDLLVDRTLIETLLPKQIAVVYPRPVYCDRVTAGI